MDRLDMSLDDMIKEKPRKPKNVGAGKKKGGKPVVAKSSGGAFQKKSRAPVGVGGSKLVQPTGASHAVVQPRAAPARRQEQRRQPLAANNGSILSRIGKPGVSASGTPVSFENLNFDIMKDDIAELCSTVGELKNAEIIYDNSGRSTGAATVTFARRSDAENAVKKFNGLTLDGTVMRVTIAGGNPRDQPSNGSGRRRGSADGKAAMFGTAMDQDDAPTFRVNLGGGGGSGGSSSGAGVCYAFQTGDCTRGNECRFRHEAGDVPAPAPRARTERAPKRGGNGGGGRGGGRGQRAAREPASATSLDDDLDGYFQKR